MLYDVRIRIAYEYEQPVSAGRQMVRLLPLSTHAQRLVAGSLSVRPEAAERLDAHDFFGNATTQFVLREPHDRLDLSVQARVSVEPGGDLAPSASLSALAADLAGMATLDPASPHHFLAPSPRVPELPDIAAWVRTDRLPDTMRDLVEAVGLRIHRGFAYDPEATEVDTSTADAFRLKRGVCQDFAHVMIASLRGLGVPAAYVSGVLRTEPPPGKPRLEGADAMHAWVRAWCGREAGWIEYDPTNALFPRRDHIVVAAGRDYSDVAPVTGIVKTSGDHSTEQSVDVTPVAATPSPA